MDGELVLVSTKLGKVERTNTSFLFYHVSTMNLSIMVIMKIYLLWCQK
jgi:hypothetical protein